MDDLRYIHRLFFHEFIPAITGYLKSRKLPLKALLLMDNAPSYPSTEMLQSKDGNIKCLFLPPNTTSQVEPMDKGVFGCTKRHYRKELLRKLRRQRMIQKFLLSVFGSNSTLRTSCLWLQRHEMMFQKLLFKLAGITSW